MSNNINDKFWGDNPNILFQTNRLVEFFPTADQSIMERMNSVTRLIIYVSVIISIYQEKLGAIHFGLFLIFIVYLIWQYTTVKETFQETFQDIIPSLNVESENISSECVMPTEQNPFMNYLVGDNPLRGPACKGSGIQEQAANLLDNQLFSDVDDLYSKNANQRLFTTLPVTTRIPDTTVFANWLIKDNNLCKSENTCPPYDDLRLQRQLIPEDLDQVNIVDAFTF